MKKSLISWMLLLTILTGICSFVPITVSAETSGNFKYSVNDGTATITGYDGKITGELVIPSEVDGYQVIAIGDSAFSNQNLTSVVIPEGVKSIGNYAFYCCFDLVAVTLPRTMKTIGEWSFAGFVTVKDVYFTGTKEELSTITIRRGLLDDSLKKATFHCDYVASDTVDDITNNIVEWNGHKYQLFDESMTWEEAKTYCESIGGHLVTITSEEENTAVCNMLNSSNMKCYWIGLSRESVNSDWKWSTNENINYTNWKSTEPNNYSNMDECYVHLFGVENQLGEWNDVTNSGASYASSTYDIKNFGFICEWDNTSSKYEVIEKIMSWQDAKAYCENLGGHLLTINSEEEQKVIEKLLESYGNNDYFIGLHKELDDFNTWVTGENVTYSNWGLNEPDNTGGQDCGIIANGVRSGRLYHIEKGQWDDVRNSCYFICEWDNISETSNLTISAPTNSYAGTYYTFEATFDTMPTNAFLQFDSPADGWEWLSEENCNSNPVFNIPTNEIIEKDGKYLYKKTFIISSPGNEKDNYNRKVRVVADINGKRTYSEDVKFFVGLPNDNVLTLAIGESRGYIGDKMIDVPAAPYISNERTLIPLRTVAENLGAMRVTQEGLQFSAKVDWDEETKTITVTNGNTIAKYKINSTEFTVKGTYYDEQRKAHYTETEITFSDDVAPILNENNNSTYIPLRKMCEVVFGRYVQYIDNKSQYKEGVIVICPDGYTMNDHSYYTELINPHTHQYVSKNDGNHSCSVCKRTWKCDDNGSCKKCGYKPNKASLTIINPFGKPSDIGQAEVLDTGVYGDAYDICNALDFSCVYIDNNPRNISIKINGWEELKIDMRGENIGTTKNISIKKNGDDLPKYGLAYLNENGHVLLNVDFLKPMIDSHYEISGSENSYTVYKRTPGTVHKDVDSDLHFMALYLSNDPGVEYWEQRIKDDGLTKLQYLYDIFNFDVVGLTSEIGENIEGEGAVKDIMIDSLIHYTEVNAYYKWINIFMDALGLGSDASQNAMSEISDTEELYSVFADAYNEILIKLEKNDKNKLDSDLFKPISEYMDEVNWILKASEVITLNVNQYAQLLSLKCSHEEINDRLDVFISRAESDKAKNLYKEIKESVNSHFIEEIMKISAKNACTLLPELIDLGAEHGIKFFAVAKGVSKSVNFAHTVASIVGGKLMKGDALYDAVSDIEKWSYCRKLLSSEIRKSLDAYKINPDEKNTLLLKTLLLPLANVVKLELDAELQLQRSYIFRGEAHDDFEKMTESSISKIDEFISKLK